MVRTFSTALILSALVLTGLSSFGQVVSAQFFDGPGIEEGIEEAVDLNTGPDGDPREVILDILFTILSYVLLILTIVVIIAGIYLVVAGGEDSTRDRVRKILLYAFIGFVIIALAAAIVGFFIELIT